MDGLYRVAWLDGRGREAVGMGRRGERSRQKKMHSGSHLEKMRVTYMRDPLG